jgi:hypothetical protein
MDIFNEQRDILSGMRLTANTLLNNKLTVIAGRGLLVDIERMVNKVAQSERAFHIVNTNPIKTHEAIM